MKTETSTLKRALLLAFDSISLQRGQDSGRTEIRVVEVHPNDVLRNPHDSELNDLVFYCQWDSKVNGSMPFAFACEYRSPYSVDLITAERQVKLLRRVHKAEFPVQPTTFGQYCVLLARLLNIELLVKEVQHSGDSYTENQHSLLPISQAQPIIDHAIQQAQSDQR